MQAAVTSALSIGLSEETTDDAVDDGVSNKEPMAASVLQQMEKATKDHKGYYYQILASVGGLAALHAVSSTYQAGSQAGNGFEKAAALRALSDWSDKDAINTLRAIARTAKEGTEKQKAMDGMLGLIQLADFPPEQRLLLLRDAFQVAGNVGQKEAILTAMKGTACFNTMAFAGQYLNNPDLQQAAAHTIMEVAMADKYKGALVRYWHITIFF